jgi:hypothetical protein
MMSLILEQTEMSTIFGSDKCLLNVLNLAQENPGNLRFLKNFIVFDIPCEKLKEMSYQYEI